MECRILAVDPNRDFQPCPGRITRFLMPTGPGIRVDRGVASDSEVPPYYDPMIAKVICRDTTREAVIARMQAALRGMRIEGVATNIGHQLEILGNHWFRQGVTDTSFLERRM
jgi:acetyl-CoA carboxylase biotin carboxylase subunit